MPGASGPDTQPRVAPTPVSILKQGTIIKYLVQKNKNGTQKEAGTQPLLPGEALGSERLGTLPSEVAAPRRHSSETAAEEKQPLGPSRAQPMLGSTGPAQPSDNPTPQEDHPAQSYQRFDITYKQDRLVEPAPLQSADYRVRSIINSIVRAVEFVLFLIYCARGFDKEGRTPRADIRHLEKADSPINDVWDRAVAFPGCDTSSWCDTSSGVYDGGGESVPEGHRETPRTHYVYSPPQDTSSSVYDGGGRSAQSDDSTQLRMMIDSIVQALEVQNTEREKTYSEQLNSFRTQRGWCVPAVVEVY